MSTTAELDARAKFNVGDQVVGPGFGSFRVIARYWRRSEDAFYYDLQEMPCPGAHPLKTKGVPESRVWPRGYFNPEALTTGEGPAPPPDR